MRGRRRDVDGEAEQVDHERDVNHAAADTEDARDKADTCTCPNAEGTVEGEVCGKGVHIRVLFVRGIPVHHKRHQQEERTIGYVEHRSREVIDDV